MIIDPRPTIEEKMIVALLRNGLPVVINDAQNGGAFVTSLGRENIGQHYQGGDGYVGTKFTSVGLDAFGEVALIDPDNCDAYQAWQDAMRDVDELCEAEDRSMVAAALEIEMRAEEAFREFVHEHRIPRQSQQNEIPPNLPPASLSFGMVGDAEDLYRSGLALQGSCRP